MLLFENIVPENRDAFVQKVKQVADRLDIDPNWLMAVMKLESNLNPSAQNPYSGAVGLIQFLPDTLSNQFRMSPATMRTLSNVQQLEYVERYLLPYRNRMTGYADVYLAVFYPAAIGQGDEYQFPLSVYAGNASMDIDLDGTLTIDDVKKWAMRIIPEAWRKIFEEERSVGEKFIRRNWLWISAISLLVMVITYYLLTRVSK